ncbi:DUF1775 domain-containing protein [Paenibacillus larvae]|nr:DUF1775 domain-containing protein [Paenibacillus larvae]MDT2263803.1 DUF1775 domain-containing protein [Paenibacillus larvae]MDT2275303.1 DUF1775 domain-containing protein [Paenibacillus larvae]
MTVSPNEAIQGSYQKFVVKVPTEKGIPTTQVKVKFDISNVKVSSFEPKPGWTYETAKDEQGNITGVTWKARGDGIKKMNLRNSACREKLPTMRPPSLGKPIRHIRMEVL